MDRTKLLKVLQEMPDEAFSWFVSWAMVTSKEYPMPFKYPGGLGGFQPESRAAIEKLHAAALSYVDSSGREHE